MKPMPDAATVRWAVQVYAVLARALPRSFRDEFGSELVLDLEILLGERWMRGGAGSVLSGLGRAVWDLAVRAVRERVRGVARWLGLRRRSTSGGSLATGNSLNDGLDREVYGLDLGERTMTGLGELRMAVRALLRRPGFTGVAVTTLGLGIGSVVAIFTLVNSILLQPLPYPESDRIVEIEHHAPAIDLPSLTNSSGTLAFYRENADAFAAVMGATQSSRVLTGIDQASQVLLMAATPEIFTVFGVQPAMGRPYGEADAVEDAAPVMVLMHSEWQGRFGGDPDILGRTVELDGTTTEIIGVMPADFELVSPGPIALVPLVVQGEPVFGHFGTTGLARLAPGVSLEQARTQLEALQSRIPDRFPSITQEVLDSFGWGVSIMTHKEDVVEDVATTLWLVLGTVGFVLLIACANVANLFLVRAEGRQKEIAVRAAMGAGRGKIAASFLNESLVLGVIGGLLGVLVTVAGVKALLAFGPADAPRLHEVAITPVVLGVAGLLSLGAGLLLGLIPMTRYAPGVFTNVLRDGGRGSTVGRGRNRARSVLVMSQLALALVLLVGSGLMFRSFAELRAVDLGFDREDVLTVGIRVGEGMAREEALRFYEDLRARVASMPGVQDVGVTTQVPLASGNSNGGSFYIESRPREEGDLPPVSMYRAAGPGFFESMGIQVLRGRGMETSDLDGSAAYVWVDEHFANTFFEGDALGERITWNSAGDEAEGDGAPSEPDPDRWAEIVGVVADVKQHGIREDPMANAYLPLQAGALEYPGLQVGFLTVKARAGQDATALTPAIREAVAQLNSQVPITRVQTLEDVVSEAMGGESITLILMGIAAGMALFLGSIGLFGVISYVVSQRTREIGVRIALGAETAEVSGMVLRQGLSVAAAGVALGLAGAFGLTRVMGSLLYEVSATDPATFVLAPVVLLAVSGLATWLPARRAARVDPIESLREE
jgi:predicted permease